MYSFKNGHGWRRLVTTGAIVAMAAASLTACSAFQNDSGGPTDSKSLVFWSMWEKGEPQSKVLQHAIDDFETKEGIKVKVQWAGRDVSKRVQTAANTGDVPDLVDDAVEVLLAGAGADVYKGLSSVYKLEVPGENQTVADVIPAPYIKPYVNKAGEPIVVPHTVTSTSIWYDGNKLPDVAANPPATWDEFVTLLSQMKAAGQSPIAADGTIPDYNAYWMGQMVLRQMGPGWLHKAAEDKTGEAFKSPEFLEVAKRLQNLVDSKYFMEGYQGSKLPAQEQAWAAGDANFLLMGSWAPLGKDEVARKGIIWRTFPMPIAKGGVNAIEVNLLGFGIPTAAKNPDNAAKFIAFFMQKDYIGGISSEANQITPRADVTPPEALADVATMLANADEGARYLDGVPSDFPNWWAGVFLPVDDKLFFGDIPATQFVDMLAQESAKYWKNN